MAPPISEIPPVIFTCDNCGVTLSVDHRQAGTSGPCPSCGAWITSPGALETDAARKPTDPAPSSGRAVNLPSRRKSARPPSRPKGRIPADSIVDHAHLEQRESMKTLKVLALFVLVICGCLATAWILKDWMAK